MNSYNGLIIGVLVCFLGCIFFLRYQEAEEFNDKIENLEQIQRFNYIAIDSLTVSNDNQKDYIKDLELSNDSLQVLSRKRGIKILEYEKKLHERDTHFFNNADDSTIVSILSGARFNP